jgi:hypothetical protein
LFARPFPQEEKEQKKFGKQGNQHFVEIYNSDKSTPGVNFTKK